MSGTRRHTYHCFSPAELPTCSFPFLRAQFLKRPCLTPIRPLPGMIHAQHHKATGLVYPGSLPFTGCKPQSTLPLNPEEIALLACSPRVSLILRHAQACKWAPFPRLIQLKASEPPYWERGTCLEGGVIVRVYQERDLNLER